MTADILPSAPILEEAKDLGAASPLGGASLTPHVNPIGNLEGFEKLPLCEPEPGKDLLGRSPIGSIFQPALMSPLNLGASKFGYGSPQAQSVVRFPYTGNPAASSCNQILGSPLNCPPTFGAYIDFSSFSNVTPCNRTANGGNLNLPNSIFGSGNCSPCFPGFSAAAATPAVNGADPLCKAEDKDN